MDVEGSGDLADRLAFEVAACAPDNRDLRFETVNGKAEIVVSPLDRFDERDCQDFRVWAGG